MSESSLSAFVQRCQEALAEYERQRAIGVSHEVASRRSGLLEAVQGKAVDPIAAAREIRRLMAGDSDVD